VSPPPSETVERDLIDGMSGAVGSMGAFEVRRRIGVRRFLGSSGRKNTREQHPTNHLVAGAIRAPR
jgi:hypothetical protein